ncbi:MAG: peptidoglycan-binding protein [Geminicoccaceae bacterium]
MQPVLRYGARGPAVELVQRRLKEMGFPPGRIDGLFGRATEAALVAFQRAGGLLADGVVGPVTWSRLAGLGAGSTDDLSARIDIAFVAEMFPATPLPSIRRHLQPVLAGLRSAGLLDKPMLLMALATIRAESEGFVPIEEQASRYNTSPDGEEFDLYDHRRDLGNLGPPDGRLFRGRGFVQLTGRDNYRRYGETVGLGTHLVAEPHRALEPTLAGRLLAAFLADRQRPIKEALLEGDLARARRLVNGGRHGLDRFVAAYRIGHATLADDVWRD